MMRCRVVVIGAALAMCASAGAAWESRPSVETPASVLDSLVALDIAPEQFLRAVVGADGVLRLDSDLGYGDALTVDLRVADGSSYAALYRRLTGSPLPDGVDMRDLAVAVNWALMDPGVFLSNGGTMSDLRRARREHAHRALGDPASVSSESPDSFTDLDKAGEAAMPTASIDQPARAVVPSPVPSPGALTALALAGGLAARRRR